MSEESGTHSVHPEEPAEGSPREQEEAEGKTTEERTGEGRSAEPDDPGQSPPPATEQDIIEDEQ
ncbi:hypothetical protein DFQ14_104240 [Halopolyspora algeriensis]|uniref:Uncharacterized protein n=1 Tax=Halopolyspora algeriensis TaxID=1500506 RepID=A0A368VSD4_9ACTN|nr:hypothetical protein [Halopolyspora algeriensis]RCW44651.1 hypothetical protein DFQ14_104240 [Halopolyspora algeriensis]TQM56012.1 hypothetical protein FHU43_0790 [Halopolyspora algeriensis]